MVRVDPPPIRRDACVPSRILQECDRASDDLALPTIGERAREHRERHQRDPLDLGVVAAGTPGRVAQQEPVHDLVDQLAPPAPVPVVDRPEVADDDAADARLLEDLASGRGRR
jgi:hypothetical protein